MSIVKGAGNVISRLRQLPDTHKKIILIGCLAFFAVLIGFFEVKSTQYHIGKINESVKTIEFPKIEINAPDFALPDIDLTAVASENIEQIFQTEAIQ